MTINPESFGGGEKPSAFRHHVWSSSHQTPPGPPGFTLIEMIGVLAVLALLAAVLLPALIKRMDQLAGEKETKQLKAFADGLRQQIVKTRFIPDQTAWDSMISSNVGLSIAQVRTNDRRLARAYLIDPNFRIGSASSPSLPPYSQASQGINGSEIEPVSPRLMLLSSLSQALPVSSGTNSGFNVIWDTAEGAVPTNWTWTGNSGDLIIQRINLADLFVQLVLNNEGTNSGRFSIDQAGPSVGPSNPFSAYFIDSTLLALFDCTNSTPRYTEILHHLKSFDFANCTWLPGGDFISKAINRPTPLDLQLAADAFLAVTTNNPTRLGWPQQNSPTKIVPHNVYDQMISYMTNYIRWRANSPNAASGDASLNSAQTDLKNSTTFLINP